MKKLLLFAICYICIFAEESKFSNAEFEIIDKNNNPLKIITTKGSNNNGIYQLVGSTIILKSKSGNITLKSDYAKINTNTSKGILSENILLTLYDNFTLKTSKMFFDLNEKKFWNNSLVEIDTQNIKVTGNSASYSQNNIKIKGNVHCNIRHNIKPIFPTQK